MQQVFKFMKYEQVFAEINARLLSSTNFSALQSELTNDEALCIAHDQGMKILIVPINSQEELNENVARHNQGMSNSYRITAVTIPATEVSKNPDDTVTIK